MDNRGWMKLYKVIFAGFGLLLAAGLSVGTASAAAKSTPSKASATPAGKTARVKKSSKHSRRRERGQKTPTPERISEIQQALAKEGSFNGTPNGRWDDSTVEAMRKCQTGHGLNPSGKLDALTLHKLGLGSKTAGIAAPMPPVSSSSNALSGSTQTAS